MVTHLNQFVIFRSQDGITNRSGLSLSLNRISKTLPDILKDLFIFESFDLCQLKILSDILRTCGNGAGGNMNSPQRTVNSVLWLFTKYSAFLVLL
jgi:hypothetical protein